MVVRALTISGYEEKVLAVEPALNKASTFSAMELQDDYFLDMRRVFVLQVHVLEEYGQAGF